MRGCWWNCWKALRTFETIENAQKCNRKARCINVGMLVELMESIENLCRNNKCKGILCKRTVY